jgi:hypothetical protein
MSRRIAGLLKTRFPEIRLEQVADPRQARGKRWKQLATLLRAAVVGIVSGCRSTADVEALTDEMSVPMRRLLRIPRRVPDTTLRSTLLRVDPDELRRCIYAQVRTAHRRKALYPVGLPFGQVAIDGKATAIGAWDEKYSQQQRHSSGPGASGIARTLTAALVTGRAIICLDAAPIPSRTNESGHFPTALKELLKAYGSLELFQLISADAGLCSEANARLVTDKGLHYLFGLKEDQPTLLRETERLLRFRRRAEAETHDVVGKTTVVRRLFTTTEMVGFLHWEHLQTVLRVHTEKRCNETGAVLEQESRYFLSSLPRDALTDEQWLRIVRNHWAVENACHQTWDKTFREDRKPWIEAGADACQGTVAVMLLRRIGYNLLALFRSVTQRSEDRRQIPWRALVRRVYNTLIAATAVDTDALRSRKPLGSSVT